jgi:hypothetical protein
VKLTAKPFDISLSSSVQFGAQWAQPQNILDLLQIIGGDVIQHALAQLSGGYFTPVPFSFGWIAYSFNSMFAVGDKKLMPEPDYPSIVINAQSGYIRDNRSWVIGRVLRDFDYWKPKAVGVVEEKIIDDAREAELNTAKHAVGTSLGQDDAIPIPNRRKRAGLCISIFVTSSSHRAGTDIAKDWVFYSGIFTIVVQLSISAIPLGLYGQWDILVITIWGTILALASGAIPQWKAEKWQCRQGKKTVILTKGNGAQHAIVIIGSNERALDLEDLADSDGVKSPLSLRLYTALLAVLWLALLITVSGVTQNSWFLLAVGGLGMVQNVLAAGAPRRPSAVGFHLELLEVIGHYRVMTALMKLEDKYPGVGANMVTTFFPGKLLENEERFWEEKAEKLRIRL